MISERLGTWARQKMLVVGAFLGKFGVTPNMLTIAGFILNCIVAAIIASGRGQLGGVLLLFASAFDMLDGAVARSTGKTSKFGGFFDSTVDRYSEIIVYVGLLWYILGTDDWKWGAMLVLLSGHRRSDGQLCARARRGGRLEGVGWHPGTARARGGAVAWTDHRQANVGAHHPGHRHQSDRCDAHGARLA
ncbi:MAG: CDP-alcohol phosphatidyltransferase family protein [Thermomicrobiales bacterium]